MSLEQLSGEWSAVEGHGDTYLRTVRAIEQAIEHLQAIRDEDVTIARSFDRVREAAGEVSEQIGLATSRYEVTGRSLVEYAEELRLAQQRADAAIDEHGEAAARLRGALAERDALAGLPTHADASVTAVRELRAAVRALFARAVRPGEPSPADATRLMPQEEAVRHLNEAAAHTPTVPVLHWPEGATPLVHAKPVRAADELAAVLAHSVIAFLASADRDRLRACHAPRCVRYFLKEHPRQEWCKPSCGNRARVARHHQRHKATA